MKVLLPIILPEASFEDQVRFLWTTSIRFSGDQSPQVLVSSSGVGDIRDFLYYEDRNTLAFRKVSDFIGLADFRQWFVPFPAFMRLACLHLYLDRVKASCNSSLLKNSENQNALYWTFWLQAQGIEHQRHFI